MFDKINVLVQNIKKDIQSTRNRILFDATGYSPRNLARMKKFFETYRDLSNLPTALAKLPWSFNCLLIDKVDETIKRKDNNKTIGLLLCKNKDACTVDWSLKGSSAPIGVASYEINKYLPTEEEINRLWK